MEIEQESPLQSNSNVTYNQHSNHRIMSHLSVRLLLIASTVKSILGLIILFLLFVISTGVFFIGFYYRHSSNCPIEPRISCFLMITGSLSIEWIILSLILSTITIVRKHIQSLILISFIILTALIIIITNLFLTIWAVFGSIWTLKALEKAQYTDSHLNTFCRRTLYQFTLGYLVVTYILSALQCWYRLCIIIFCSMQKQ
jgi:hypothetical protein